MPFPGVPFQASAPDSKPSAKTTFEYPCPGVTGGDGAEAGPVPTALIACAVKV